MTEDCKHFLSSSEPAPRTNPDINDIVCPEDEVKMEEKIAMFSKNVNDIVRDSEEKFYKSLSSAEYPEKKNPLEGIYKGAGEGIEDEKKEEKKDSPTKKFTPFCLSPFASSSPRTLRPLKKIEKKVNLDSKAMADALNEQAKQYIENQNEETEELKEIQEKYPPKEISQEAIEENLALWGMTIEQISDNNETEQPSEKGDEKKEEENCEETSQMESVRSVEQRKEKPEEEVERADEERDECKPSSLVPTPKTSPRKVKPSKETFKSKETTDEADLISAMFQDLIKNGCAVSQTESENLQNMLKQVSENPEPECNDVLSICTSEALKSGREEKITARSLEEKEKRREKEERRKNRNGDLECLLEEVSRKKILKMKNEKVQKASKRAQRKQEALEDKMKFLRKALPSLAAENEAAHLKQLKKYIDKFINRAEASTNSEFSRRKESRRRVKGDSTDSSEVRVDASKILDFVSSPFSRISSEVTINIAKKLTDTLVQDKAIKNFSVSGKARKQSENETDDEGFPLCGASSGSERCGEPEPTYLKQLKKMRNEHLNNILLEVKRLSELLRFLDRCNRLHF